jgi:hypothetical protein
MSEKPPGIAKSVRAAAEGDAPALEHLRAAARKSNAVQKERREQREDQRYDALLQAAARSRLEMDPALPVLTEEGDLAPEEFSEEDAAAYYITRDRASRSLTAPYPTQPPAHPSEQVPDHAQPPQTVDEMREKLREISDRLRASS